MTEDPGNYLHEELERLKSKLVESDDDHRAVKDALRRLITVVGDLPNRRDIEELRSTQQKMDIRQQQMLSMLRMTALRITGMLATAAAAIAGGLKDNDLISTLLDKF